MYEKVFTPIKIGPVEIPNRLFMPPMATGIGDETRLVEKYQTGYYLARAKGGVGLVNTSAFAVDLDTAGLVEAGQPSLTVPGAGEKLEELIDAVHEQSDAKICVQLLHPGRQTTHDLNPGKDIVAPSALPEAPYMETPRALTTDEVKGMVQKFVDAARIAYDAGADGVEIHAAHGYLINEFMSPRANQRDDEYGGSFENRMRFVTEIIDGIKAIKPADAFLSIRMNAYDAVEGGIDIELGLQIAKYLEGKGLDAIDLSLGTYTNSILVSEPAIYPEGVRSEWVKTFTDALSIPVISVNNVKRPQTAEQLLEDGICDMVGIGRALLADPDFPNKMREGREDEINSCLGCCECLFMHTPEVCSINPYLGLECELNDETMRKDGDGREVVVIGAGPGGFEAAEVAAKRGFAVDILEAKDVPGGSLVPASKGPGKDKFAWYTQNKVCELQKLGVTFHYNTKVESAADLVGYNPYAVFVAIGAEPAAPAIPGTEGENVVQAVDVLMADPAEQPAGKKVVIIGSGMTGLETAEVLVAKGNTVTMYDMLSEIAPTANLYTRIANIMELMKAGVQLKTDHKLVEVKGSTVVLENTKEGVTVEDEADLVVLSLGVKSNSYLDGALDGVCDKVYYVGDCVKGGNVYDATSSAFECAWNM